MSKNYIIGLPLNKKSITKKFTDFISSDKEIIGLITSSLSQNTLEGKSSSVGYNLLLKNGFEFFSVNSLNIEHLKQTKKIVLTLDDIWINNQGKRKVPLNVALKTISLMEKLKQLYPEKHIVRFCPGNPYKSDSVTFYMLNVVPLMEVINCKSSSQLAYEELKALNLTKGLPPNFIQIINTDHKIDNNFISDAVNLLDCVMSIYINENKFETILSYIESNDNIYAIYINDSSKIEKITLSDIRKLYEKNSNLEPFVLAIIKNV